MKFAWFILIYCFLAKATGDKTSHLSTNDNQTQAIIVIPPDKSKSTSKINLEVNSTKSLFKNLTASTNSTEQKSKQINDHDLLSALPSTSSLTTLPVLQVKYNKNREIHANPDIVHKSIPIQVNNEREKAFCHKTALKLFSL